jgi:hypothetical protein
VRLKDGDLFAVVFAFGINDVDLQLGLRRVRVPVPVGICRDARWGTRRTMAGVDGRTTAGARPRDKRPSR